MKRLIAEIPFVPYGFRQDGNDYSCEPSHQEIQFAIDKGQLEDRGFQTHLDELSSEWASNARSLQEFADRQREYNARRIAYFVVHGQAGDGNLSIDSTGKRTWGDKAW